MEYISGWLTGFSYLFLSSKCEQAIRQGRSRPGQCHGQCYVLPRIRQHPEDTPSDCGECLHAAVPCGRGKFLFEVQSEKYQELDACNQCKSLLSLQLIV